MFYIHFILLSGISRTCWRGRKCRESRTDSKKAKTQKWFCVILFSKLVTFFFVSFFFPNLFSLSFLPSFLLFFFHSLFSLFYFPSFFSFLSLLCLCFFFIFMIGICWTDWSKWTTRNERRRCKNTTRNIYRKMIYYLLTLHDLVFEYRSYSTWFSVLGLSQKITLFKRKT